MSNNKDDFYKELINTIDNEARSVSNDFHRYIMQDASKAIRDLLAERDVVKKQLDDKPVLVNTVNDKVIEAFIAGQAAKSANLTTDGTTLYSYGYYQLARHVKGVVILRFGELYSYTTKKHMALLRKRLVSGGFAYRDASTETPYKQPEMEYDTQPQPSEAAAGDDDDTNDRSNDAQSRIYSIPGSRTGGYGRVSTR